MHDYFTGADEADIYATLEESFPTARDARCVALMHGLTGRLARIPPLDNASAQHSQPHRASLHLTALNPPD